MSKVRDFAEIISAGITASDAGLGNVTNESKATMFTSPTFTGTPVAPVIKLTPGSAPSSPVEGQIYYDSTTDTVKIRNASKWNTISSGLATSTSSNATVTYYSSGGNDYVVYTFLTSGTFTPTATFEIDYLVVAGGGGGGSHNASGGGAGGLLYVTGYGVIAQEYIVTIGLGGAGGSNSIGVIGQNSVVIPAVGAVITAIGGGYGGSGSGSGGTTGGTGGSGGGTSGSATSGQGNVGGSGSNYGDAGGGAGAAGQTGNPGNGGVGIANSIDGTSYYYAGGGGSSRYINQAGNGGSGGGGGGGARSGGSAAFGTGGLLGRNNGVNGTVSSEGVGGNGGANTGGGGGGANGSGGSGGGTGGSGIVIIRYAV
jgi:hypothetical protein